MIPLGYISDMEKMFKASRSHFRNDGAAAFELSEGSLLSQALPAKHLPGRRTQVFNVCRINRLDHHPGDSDEGSAPKINPDPKNQRYWNCDLGNPNSSEDNCNAEFESDTPLTSRNEDPESQELWDVSA